MKKVLLTGFSGFLGNTILDFLENNKYEVVKVGRNKNADILCDLSINSFPEVEADYVIHVAGKAHVIPKTIEEKEDFFKVNYIGTKNLLTGLNLNKLKTIIFISTVAVYGKEVGELIDENTPLKGFTPYALSKTKAEETLMNFGAKNNINIVVLRLPLITGKNPVGNLQSMIKAIQKGYYFRIGKGDAQRSIISAIDVAKVIPDVLNLNGIYNYTDCTHPRIAQIDTVIGKKYNKKIKKLPKPLLKWFAKIGDIIPFFPFNSNKFDKLTNTLTFSNKKILQEIKFKPNNGLKSI
ncbi:NAD(P)-dependent oxidoreductase [uncultured Polaribacter sp.]|uniref:NAD-dependent epimerase/dehydratase family protein n=1 Tax=uncultured Polaribacter sp. TaxID=174711 RepID=UPI00261E2DF0|nr:NAD-dependent epimerase/dehydratase family protein [uncultured Polaribacter sp.]